MQNIIEWCNLNEGFASAVLATAGLLISVIALVLSAIAIFQTRKQTKQSDKQQIQNVAMSLLPLRQEVLKGFSEKRFNDIFWDATILFSKGIADSILAVGMAENAYKGCVDRIEMYFCRMKSDVPDLYNEFNLFQAQLENDDSFEALFVISDKFKPIVQMPGETEEMVFDYRYLHSEEQAAKRKYDALFTKVFMDIKAEIQKSIQL
jgi:hypothetical protein